MSDFEAMVPSLCGRQGNSSFTARWALFSVAGGRSRFARAEHPPWPLCRARPIDVRDHLMAAAGLPPPQGEPIAHYSPGVDVRIGRPEP